MDMIRTLNIILTVLAAAAAARIISVAAAPEPADFDAAGVAPVDRSYAWPRLTSVEVSPAAAAGSPGAPLLPGLKVRGVFADGGNPSLSFAILSMEGKDEIYVKEGEPVTDSITLKSVQRGAVVIEGGGREETVHLSEDAAPAAGLFQIVMTKSPDDSAPANPGQAPGLIISDPDHKIVKPLTP